MLASTASDAGRDTRRHAVDEVLCGEQLARVGLRVAQQQVAADDVDGHLDQAPRVVVAKALVFGVAHVGHGLGELRPRGAQALEQVGRGGRGPQAS